MKKLLMLLLMLLVVFLLVATAAFAVIDPHYNRIGLYWDTDADSYHRLGTPDVVDLHIIMTNPWLDALGGFECGISIEGEIAPFLLGVTFANPEALDVAQGFQNFIVGFGSPTNCTQATLLATIRVLNSACVDLAFFLHEANPPSIEGEYPVILLTDGSLEQVVVSNWLSDPYWNYGEATASMDGCTVAVESTTWDKVRSLYR